MLHITNGDSAAELIRQARPGEEVLPWRDVLHEGPLPAGLGLEEFSEARARFLAGCGWGEYSEIRRSFADRDSAVLAAENLTLWFEHDLYDQLQLIQILDTLVDRPAVVELISIDRFPGVAPFHGLGQLRPEQIAILWPARQRVTGEQFRIGREAWDAVCSGSTREMVTRDLTALPFLRAALIRYLEDEPDWMRVAGQDTTGKGAGAAWLGRTERQILKAVAAGAGTPVEVFLANQEMEEAPFMGDSSLFRRLERMQGGADPLLTRAPIRLTEAGERALAVYA